MNRSINLSCLVTLCAFFLAACISPIPSPTPSGDWGTYTDSQNGISFSYPPGWSETAPGRFEGVDGFVQIETLPDDGSSPTAACQLEANRGKPERYGAFPEIVDLPDDGVTACLILPSDDQPKSRGSEAAYLAWPPTPGGDRVTLRADRDHISTIAQSLRFAQPPQESVSHCDTQVSADPLTYTHGSFSIAEYPMAKTAGEQPCIPALEPEVFFQKSRTNRAASTRQAEMVRGQWGPSTLARLNEQLAPFGYTIREAEDLFTIYRGEEMVEHNLSWLGQFSASSDGSAFLLPVVDSYNSASYVLSEKGIDAQENWDILLYDRVFPIHTAGGLVSLAYDYDRFPRPIERPALLNVLVDGQVTNTYSLSPFIASGGPARRLTAWDGGWVLDLSGIVIQNGEILNESLGYSEMFTWRLLGGSPFYFYRQDGVIHLNHNGQDLPVSYDEVIYQPQNGRAVLLQMQNYENGLAFYARRAGEWFWIIVQAN